MSEQGIVDIQPENLMNIHDFIHYPQNEIVFESTSMIQVKARRRYDEAMLTRNVLDIGCLFNYGMKGKATYFHEDSSLEFDRQVEVVFNWIDIIDEEINLIYHYLSEPYNAAIKCGISDKFDTTMLKIMGMLYRIIKI